MRNTKLCITTPIVSRSAIRWAFSYMLVQEGTTMVQLSTCIVEVCTSLLHGDTSSKKKQKSVEEIKAFSSFYYKWDSLYRVVGF